MTDEFDEEKSEKSESKSEKDNSRVDKEFLSKAKDSRDIIDKKLRTFENSIENITDTIKNGKPDDERKDNDKKNDAEINLELSEAKENLETTKKKVDDKVGYLTALQEEIGNLQERYNRKTEELQNLEERMEIIQESKEKMEIEFQELLKNNEQLVKTYETRQVDLIVLTDSVKEKVALQDELRAKIAKQNQTIQDNEYLLDRQREDAISLEMKLKSQTAENETLKVSIGKNRFELDHSNKEIEAKDEEKKNLNEQIEKKEQRIKIIEQQIEDYKQGFPEMEKQTSTYEELLAKYKLQLSEKQQDLITIESRIQELNDTYISIQEQIANKGNLLEVNEKHLQDIKQNIESTNSEYFEREERLNSLSEKLEYMQDEHDKLIKAKEVIEQSTSDSRATLQKLKVELDNQENEIRDKESRIHRLELLSTIYRVSKFFGGILIGMGILFAILSFGYLVNIIDFGDIDSSIFGFILLIGSIFILASGIFHLEKS